MDRVLTSYRFLGSTAVCCGLAVALALWIVRDATGVARAVAALVALTASLAVMLLIAAALADETRAETVVVPPNAIVPAAATPEPVAEARPNALAGCLEEGQALRDGLEPGSLDAWLEGTRETIEECRPGVAGYFNALAQRTYADDRQRLDAYLKRLETIVRDLS